jgi:hypothetical protein
MTLNEVMKETAEAICEKTGKSELIKPVDFAEEIKSISAGGGSAESGGEDLDSLMYFKVSFDMGDAFISQLARLRGSKYTRFDSPVGNFITEGVVTSYLGGDLVTDLSAAAFTPELLFQGIVNYEGTKMEFNSINDIIAGYGLTFEELLAEGGITERISKEQFWDLTTPINLN